MFIEHFQMSDNPFQEYPPEKWLLCDERFQQALARLKFFRKQGQLALLFGQTGVGKSSLLRLFKNDLPKNRYHPLFFHLTNMPPIAFLRTIVSRLGEHPKMGKDRLLEQITARIRSNESDTLLVIDEAHLLDSQILIDLRLLISGDLDANLRLKIVLCAQQALGTTLKRAEHADFLGRVNVQYHMGALTKIQTSSYIAHRLECAGSTDKLFDHEAGKLIHDYSGGIPRQINNIATACLINAASKNMKQINDELVNQTMAEFCMP